MCVSVLVLGPAPLTQSFLHPHQRHGTDVPSQLCQMGTFPGDCSSSEDGKHEFFSSRNQAETLPRVVLTESCCQWGQVAKAVKEGLGRVASRCFRPQLGPTLA